MMKKIYLLLVLLCCVWGGGLRAQTAEEVIKRSYKAAGIEQLDLKDRSMKLSMEVTGGGMTLPISSVIKYPDKMRTRMNMMGMNMEIVVNGNEGWMVIPGQGTQPLPQDQVAQMWQQSDVLSSMKWDTDKYDLELLEPRTESGRKFDAVDFKIKELENGAVPIERMVVCFDQETGLMAFVEMDLVEGGSSYSTKTVMDDYKTMEGGIRYPSKIDVYMNGTNISSIRITDFVLDYPTTDEMFARPQ